MTKDMTAGSPAKLIVSFAVPLIFGNLFQQFYSMVDTIIVGRFLGTGALAAVGSTGSLNFLILGFCLGLCMGTTIPVAQSFGSKDYHALRRFVGNIVWLSAFVALAMAAATVLLCRRILEWMSTPGDIIDDAYSYIVVIFAGIPVTFLYNTLAGLLRALGDSRTPVIFLVIASVLNIPVRNIQIALARFDRTLFETFPKAIRTLSKDFFPQICHFFRRKRLLEVAVDTAQEPAVHFLHRPDCRHELGSYASIRKPWGVWPCAKLRDTTEKST